MNLALLVGVLLFFFGTPAQRKPDPNACDHAAPPAGMRWVCAAEDGLRLSSRAVDQEARIWMRLKNPVHQPGGPVHRLPHRLLCCSRVSRCGDKCQKQGSVSATLVLTAEGVVQEVRIQSGDPEFAKAARLAFQQGWFAPGGRPETFRAP